MKKRHYIFLILSILTIVGAIYLNYKTVSYSENRIINELATTPISELINKNNIQSPVIEGDIIGEQMVVEEEIITNSYNKIELTIIIVISLVIVITLSNIIFTSFGKCSIVEMFTSKKRRIYYSIFLTIISIVAITSTVIISDKQILNNSSIKPRNEKAQAILEIKDNQSLSSEKKESINDDTSVIQVSNNANFIAEALEILKLSGSTTDAESSLYFGLNSAFISKDGSNSELKDSSVTTTTDYGTGLFITNSTTTLNNVTVNTSDKNSNGIVLFESGELSADKLNITTKGENSAALTTLSSSDFVSINDALLSTEGKNSPLIYNKGKTDLLKVTGISKYSPIAIIEDTNSLTIEDSELTTNLEETKEDYLLSGITILKKDSQTESANYASASLTIKNSTIRIDKESKNYETAPMFYVTNNKAIINITDTKIKYGSNILLKAEANSLYGDTLANGADIVLTATDQTLKGEIIIDKISKIRLHLNNSYFEGTINKDNLSNNVDVTFDKNTIWSLTDDAYVNTLTIQNGRIDRLNRYIYSNGHNIYYNVNNNEWLNGKTIRLNGGGKLIPITVQS